ncbi:MAG: isoprenylcysteine carboxylmethyltransferase family protein [Candidatus Acidiferrales bacterium]
MRLNIITLLVGLSALGFAAYFIVASHQPWTPLKIAGVAIAIPSLVLFLIARMQLGSAFSVKAKAQKLVTTGIYSRIRNPIYVFGGLMIVGLFLYFQPILLLILIVLIPMQIVRSRNEEKVLAEKFGEEYQRYKAKTWF